MTQLSALNSIHQKGKFGNYENKNENNLLKISEISNLIIFQIVQFKHSIIDSNNLIIDSLNLPKPLKVTSNDATRILWMGPNNWLIVSSKLDLLDSESVKIDKMNFALTNLSNSKAIIEIEGDLTNEVLKKGCPLNIDAMKKDDCSNSIFNSISVTLDIVSDNPKKTRLICSRSYGESFYHSITDASLEYGYIAI
jgi:sarcosine oxidase subunit gamma